MRKTIPIVLFALTMAIWLVALIFIKNPDLVMYLAGALCAELGWIVSVFALHRYDGDLVIKNKPDGSALYTLDLDSNPEEWAKMDEIILKVKPEEIE